MKLIGLAAFGAAVAFVPAAVQAQEAGDGTTAETAAASQPSPDAPMVEQAEPEKATQLVRLPANTPVTLSMNNELHSRTAREGDTFPMTVVQDVMVDGHVLIPRGSRAVGELVWRTGRGAFGKSAKIEVALRYIEMAGRRIPLNGYYRQEGEGNTAATVGAVLGAGVIGGLIVTGRCAIIPAGRELQARTIDEVPFEVSGEAPAILSATYQASPIRSGRERQQIVRRRPEPGER